MTDWFGYYAVLPSILVVGCLLALVALPAFRGADSPPSPRPGRDIAIDGLRGFLAIAVVIHHLEMSVHSVLTETGGLPPSVAYTIFGQAGVALFFMITGYLFWAKMLVDRGRPDWIALYVGRLFRLLPLYYVLIAATIAIVAANSGVRLAVAPAALARTVVKLGAGGFFDVGSFNGDPLFGALIGPTWTLRYEWLFYASLLVTGQVCRSRRGGLLAPPVLLAVLAIYTVRTVPALDMAPASICVLEFLIGMTIASLRSAVPAGRLPEPLGSVVMAGVFALAFTLFGNAAQTLPVLWLGLFFALVASGHTLFGLLRSRPARRLGDVSYGIYLLQNPIGWAAAMIDPLSARSPLAHWVHMLATLAALVAVATVMHVTVERTGIDAGRRAVRRLRLLRATPSLRALHRA